MATPAKVAATKVENKDDDTKQQQQRDKEDEIAELKEAFACFDNLEVVGLAVIRFTVIIRTTNKEWSAIMAIGQRLNERVDEYMHERVFHMAWTHVQTRWMDGWMDGWIGYVTS
jgi:hypothetical protein